MKHPVLTFIATFVFALSFFYGLILLLISYVPAFGNLVIPQQQPTQQTPQAQETTSAPAPTPTSTPNLVLHPYPKLPLNPPFNPAEAGQNFIRIPSIDVNVPLVESKSLSDADVIASLQNGASLYPNGVTPGALGNVFVAAHSSGYPWQGKYRFAFTRINEIKNGDTMLIDWKGTRYTYKVYKSETIVPTKGYTVPSDHLYPTMSIMACWPIWSISHRILVHADLISITQLNPRI